jgi:predicted dehydrogenase
VVEKPVDVSVAAGRDVAEAAARHPGLVAAVISQHRFDPASVAVHEAVTRGELGRVTSAVATVSWWRSQGYYDSGDWRGTWALDGGGALMNQGVHTVDLLLWFLGRPIDVVAHTALLAHERVEVEDTVAAVVRFESGALATLHATTAAYPGLTVRLQVMGDAGSAVVDNDRLYYFHSAHRSTAPAAGDAGVGPTRGVGGDGNQAAEVLSTEETGRRVGGGPGTSAMFDPHHRQYRDILEAIRTGRAPGVTVADALLALATVQAVYESARTGAPVLIADVLDGRVVPAPESPRRPAEVS